MPETESGPPSAPLDEFMLAMDVVDTLRRRRALVERELAAEDCDARMLARLRKIYASQGIEVPEHVLAEGVAALREERFAYTPPAPGFAVSLAHVWIDRWRWARRLLFVLLIGAALWAGYYLVVERPARIRITAEVRTTNEAVAHAGEQLDALVREKARLDEVLGVLTSSTPTIVGARIEEQAGTARVLLREAAALLDTGRDEPRPAELTSATLSSEGEAARRWLSRRQAALARVKVLFAAAEASLTAITDLRSSGSKIEEALRVFDASASDAEALAAGLAGVSAQLRDLRTARDAAIRISAVPEGRDRAAQLCQDGVAALRSADFGQARAAAVALAELKARLETEYTIRIQSDRSAVWRVPDRNPQARNYYLLVGAIDPGGRALALPIKNEENGRTSTVRIWGIRVGEDVFERVRADKQDDGIIQASTVGVKRRGCLAPEYTIPVLGGAITSW